MQLNYDKNNVFAKILRGEIPAKKVYENDYALAFFDIAPVAPTHILVIPKGEYVNFSDFIQNARPDEISGYYIAAEETAKIAGVSEYRIVSNSGKSSGQTVFHFHTHIIAGKILGGFAG
ncbi:MAG: HIT domain-containing protein [Rickettsiaceae bacterium]|nr:HIT domain-containing protein [Rickettsiaceae bacterium]